jgi:hypothetical protein
MDTLVPASVLRMPFTYARQMLHVSIHDPLRAQSEDDIQHIGENGLIDVHSGHVNWEQQLDIEIKGQMGKMLVMGKSCTHNLLRNISLILKLVCAQAQTRHDIRNLVRSRVDKNVELFEPEFQPWGQTGSLRAFLKP